MSGIELAGLVVGAFPLAVTAMEHYQETAKAAGTFWRIRTVYRKDYRSVTFCQTKLKLHMEELLGPLVSVDITDNLALCLELLQKPGCDGWIDKSPSNPVEARLRHCYQPYQDTLEELNFLMEKLNKKFKIQNAQFEKLVSEKSPASPRDDFKTKVRALAKDTAFQGPKLLYSINFSQREAILHEVEKYIDRLKELLQAIDRVSASSQARQSVQRLGSWKPLLQYWRHAHRMYKLVSAAMKCSCRSHCALIWLRQQDASSSASLRIALQQSENAAQAGGSRDKHKLHIKHVDEPMPVVISAANCPAMLPNTQLLTSNDDPLHSAKSIKSQKPPTVTFSQPLGNHEAVANLMEEGPCKTLSSDAATSACFGYLHDEHDDVKYRIYSDSGNDQESQVSVSVSTALKSDFRPPFYRKLRYGLALKLAIAQLRFHPSPWMPKA